MSSVAAGVEPHSVSAGVVQTAAPADVYLNISGIGKSFRGTRVIEQLDLQVGRGEFVSLLGPSGCGKTTLLRLIAGLLRADSGHILLDGHDLTRLPAHKRNVGVVFQNYALWPHLNVWHNVAYGLTMRRIRAAEKQARVASVLDLVQMGAYADRLPNQLSGGQQQRLCIARALAVDPQILLMDEPAQGLDIALRRELHHTFRRIRDDLGLPMLLVTHDISEALTLGDSLLLYSRGKIVQQGPPQQTFDNPNSKKDGMLLVLV